MVVNVTSIRLKNLFLFFRLSYNGMLITRQAKAQKGFVTMKNTGFGFDHYTLSVWEDEASLHAFARSGAHLATMKISGQLANEIITYSYDSEEMPSWKEVKAILKEKGKSIKYSS